MKFSMAILIALAHSAPSKVNLEDPDYLPEEETRSLETICSTLDDEFIVITHDITDNGQSGKLTMDKRYGLLTLCSEPIGQQCKKGVKFSWNMYFPSGLYNKKHSPYWMWAEYYNGGEFLYTERYYGSNPYYSQYNPPSNEFELINANNVKIVMWHNKMPYTLRAHATIEWECLDFDPNFPMSNKWATNTWQMAQAILTKDFTPQMAENYGCAGRGTFDAYESTLGKPVNDIDAAFLTWKKCVKCASGEDENKVVPYRYDATIDSCGAYMKGYMKDTSQDFCECDRALMEVLKNAPADTGYSMYSWYDCYKPGQKNKYVPLTCCKWNENFWAAYNPTYYCCGADGVRTIGTC